MNDRIYYRCQVRGCSNTAITYCKNGPAYVCAEHHSQLHANLGKMLLFDAPQEEKGEG